MVPLFCRQLAMVKKNMPINMKLQLISSRVKCSYGDTAGASNICHFIVICHFCMCIYTHIYIYILYFYVCDVSYVCDVKYVYACDLSLIVYTYIYDHIYIYYIYTHVASIIQLVQATQELLTKGLWMEKAANDFRCDL